MTTLPISWWQMILIILSFFSCILILFFTIIKSKKNLELNPFKGSIKITDKEPAKREDRRKKPEDILEITNEKTSIILQELTFVISKSIEFGRDIGQLNNISIIKDQMNSSQSKVDRARNTLLKEYQDAISNEDAAPVFLNNQHYLMFNLILKEWGKDILSELKRSFRENHLYDYSDDAYEEYINDIIRKILDASSIYMGEMIPEFFGSNRKLILDIYRKKQDKMYETLKSCFYDARRITIEYTELIEEKEKEFEKVIKKITGKSGQEVIL